MAAWDQDPIVEPSQPPVPAWAQDPVVGEVQPAWAMDPVVDAPEASWGDRAQDFGISALKGAIAVPEAAVGLLDIGAGLTGLPSPGKALESVGFEPGKAKAILSAGYSPAQQQAFGNVEQAEGIVDTAKAAIQNPSVIAQTVVESVPLMFGGGLAGRGLSSAAKLAPIVAGAAGEGLVTAGSSAAQIRQQAPTGELSRKQAAIATGTGALTGALGILGGKAAQKMGITDLETLIASGKLPPTARLGIVKSVIYGAAQEGLIEELPQSVQEQIAQNMATGRPLTEGVDQAAVMGALAGMATGGPVQAIGADYGNNAVGNTVASAFSEGMQEGAQDASTPAAVDETQLAEWQKAPEIIEPAPVAVNLGETDTEVGQPAPVEKPREGDRRLAQQRVPFGNETPAVDAEGNVTEAEIYPGEQREADRRKGEQRSGPAPDLNPGEANTEVGEMQGIQAFRARSDAEQIAAMRTDPVTGALNARAMNEDLQDGTAKPGDIYHVGGAKYAVIGQDGQPVGVSLKADTLKTVNDEFGGHEAGDQYIKAGYDSLVAAKGDMALAQQLTAQKFAEIENRATGDAVGLELEYQGSDLRPDRGAVPTRAMNVDQRVQAYFSNDGSGLFNRTAVAAREASNESGPVKWFADGDGVGTFQSEQQARYEAAGLDPKTAKERASSDTDDYTAHIKAITAEAAREAGAFAATRGGDELYGDVQKPGQGKALGDAINAKLKEKPFGVIMPNGEYVTPKTQSITLEEGATHEQADHAVNESKAKRSGKPTRKGAELLVRARRSNGGGWQGTEIRDTGVREVPGSGQSARRYTDTRPVSPAEFNSVDAGLAPIPNTIDPSGPSLTVGMSSKKLTAILEKVFNPLGWYWTNDMDRKDSAFDTGLEGSNATKEAYGVGFENPDDAEGLVRVTFRPDGIAGSSMQDGTARIEHVSSNAIERIEYAIGRGVPGEPVRKRLKAEGFTPNQTLRIWTAPKVEKAPDTGLRKRADDTPGTPTGINAKGEKTFAKPGELGDRKVYQPSPQAIAKKVIINQKIAKQMAIFKKKGPTGSLQSTLIPGLSQEKVNAIFEIASLHVQSGAITFADFSKALVKELGEAIRPYLKKLYTAVKEKHGYAEMEDIAVAPPVTPGKSDQETTPPAETGGFDAPVEKWIGFLNRAFHDKLAPVKRTQESIGKAKGKITEASDAYMLADLASGKIGQDFERITREHVDPLQKKMAVLGIDLATLDDYLYARHAEERNITMADRNAKLPDGGSGMSTEDARAILASVERNPALKAKLTQLAALVDAMRKENLTTLVQSGLAKPEDIAQWLGQWKHYVPLKTTKNGAFRATGKGLDTRGRESRMALGRTSRAESPTLHTIAQLQQATMRARKNEAGQGFLKLVQENPNKGYWEVFGPELIANGQGERRGNWPMLRRFNETKGEVEFYPDTNPMGPEYFGVKVDGKQYNIKINDERLVNALKNLGPSQLGDLLSLFRAPMRLLSATRTSLNPEFISTNLQRDIQTAVINGLAVNDTAGIKVDTAKLTKDIVKGIPGAMKGMYRTLRGKDELGEWQKWAKELRDNGGPMAFGNIQDVQSAEKNFERMIKMHQGGAWAIPRAGKALLQFIEDANGAVENGSRLSAYRSLREMGVSPEKATSIVRNLTVNFQRHGELGPAINTLYLFFNASIQGSATLVKAVGSSKKAQAAMGAAVGLGFALAELNRYVAGNDDDEENRYDKIPDHVKERNVILPKFWRDDGAYGTLALPYGYNVPFVFGSLMSDYGHGKKTAPEVAKGFAFAVLDAFDPLGGGDSRTLSNAIAKRAAPSLVDPIVELAINEDYKGDPITNDNQFEREKPASQRTKKNSKEHWKALATFLNQATGGSEFMPGSIDISPDAMGHMADFIGGGTGGFISRTGSAITKAVKGEEVPTQEIPFYRTFNKELSPYRSGQIFRERSQELAPYQNEYLALHGAERSAYYQKNKERIGLANQADVIGRIKNETLRDSRITDFNRKYNRMVK